MLKCILCACFPSSVWLICKGVSAYQQFTLFVHAYYVSDVDMDVTPDGVSFSKIYLVCSNVAYCRLSDCIQRQSIIPITVDG